MGKDDYPFFKHPFTAVLSGSTGSGKTEWMMRFLQHIDALVDNPPRRILYCYGELNERVLALQRGEHVSSGTQMETHSGLPSEEFVRKRGIESNASLLLVLDDLMVGMDGQLLDTLFTRGSHNWGVSVVLITQHLFARELRTARNNSHYLILMRNPAGELQVRNLATQLFPHRGAYFLEAYRDATREMFSYLIVDVHPSTEEAHRLKTHIYPDERPVIVYVPR